MNWQEVDVYVALPEALNQYEAKTHTLVPVVVRGSMDRPSLFQTMTLRPEQRVILAQTVGYPK